VPARGEVAFAYVRFAYPTRTDAGVLDGVTLRVSPGEKVAIVGPSGAGKSTIFHLLLRFYDPQFGHVSFDGVRLTDADPGALRARIALVPQDVAIFAASIADNIRFGRAGASDADVKRAAELALADEFIARLPQGYDTTVGERGVTLSGGQRQRIAIARAVIRNTPILILDEPTSGLDSASEHLVFEALDRLMQNKTTIVIAHRLSTVRRADVIFVIEDGQIVEKGKHEQLLANRGLYSELYDLQFGEASLEPQNRPSV